MSSGAIDERRAGVGRRGAVRSGCGCVERLDGIRRGGGAARSTRLPPALSVEIRALRRLLRTSTTLPKVSTKTKCSATEIVKKRDRPSRPMKARNAGCRGSRKEKAAMEGRAKRIVQGTKTTTGKRANLPMAALARRIDAPEILNLHLSL